MQQTARQLYELEQQKERLDAEIKELNIQIQRVNGELVSKMTEAGTTAFSDIETGIKWELSTIYNVKQTDEGKLNDKAMAEAFRALGADIFKQTVHAQTLKSVVTKEFMEVDDLGNIILPESIKDYVSVSEFVQAKRKK